MDSQICSENDASTYTTTNGKLDSIGNYNSCENIVDNGINKTSTSEAFDETSKSIACTGTIEKNGIKRAKTGRKSMRKVKNNSIGEIPLRPVGLSLSGSGMQLYVKVNNILHKEQLASLENQFVAKVCKVKKSVGVKIGQGVKKSGWSQSAETSFSSQNPANDNNKANGPAVDIDTSHSHAKGCFTDGPMFCEEPIEVDDDSEPSFIKTGQLGFEDVKKESLDDENDGTGKLCDRDAARGEQVFSYSGDNPGNPTSRNTNKSSIGSVHQHQSLRNFSRRKAKRSETNKHHCQEQKGKRTQGIQTNPIADWAIVKPKPILPKSQLIKRPIPSVFTSSDLPLKRHSAARSCSSADLLLHQQRNNSGIFSPINPMKNGALHTLCSTNNASLCCPDYSQKSIMSVENTRDTSKYALIYTEDRVSHSRPLPRSVEETSAVSSPGRSSPSTQQTNHSDSEPGSDRRLEDTITPISCADFDAAQVLASGTVDAETLAKFAQYTSSMRRDLKQGYKKLSLLMKTFNHDVLEHFQEEADTQTSVSADLESDHFESGSTPRMSCALM
ncbi:hypothetical protein PoB_005122400 [Plakobranchus ocellatus]|uniref:Uncharacterized protein n=1 Tax=Plakobranchus ocellatus TaxID=259542 RepID=A0AAV4C219_9GAST|nr:hypothetical protein PoB_005122400 [Plakobranchus ocellatus]